MAMFPKLKDWITLRDKGLLGDLKRKNEKRKETMLQLFGAEGNTPAPSPEAPTDTRTPSAKNETEAERQRRLRKKYGISND